MVQPPAGQLDATGSRFEQARNRLQERRLSGSIGADYRDDLPCFNVQGDISQDAEIAISDVYVLQFKQKDTPLLNRL